MSPTGCRESGLHPIPGNEDGREHAEDVLTHRVEEAEILRKQVIDRLIDELQKVSLHRACSFDTTGNGSGALYYGMRKFWSELLNVPDTCAMLPTRVAWRAMSALMELAVASRCCFAATTFCSRSESNSLFES